MNPEHLQQLIERKRAENKKNLKTAQFFENLKKEVSDNTGNDRIVWSTDTYDRIRREGVKASFQSTFEPLNKLIGKSEFVGAGFRPGQLVTFAAVGKSGKTSLCLNLIDWLQDQNPFFLALEQPAEELIETYIEKGWRMPRFAHTNELTTYITIDWITKRILAAMEFSGSKLVIIDHFRFVKEGKEFGESTTELYERVLHELKFMAKALGITLFLITHAKRSGEPTRPPTVDDVKGSSSFHEVSDMLFLLWRETLKDKAKGISQTNRTMLTLGANRRYGNSDYMWLEFNKGYFNETIYDAFEEENDHDKRFS